MTNKLLTASLACLLVLPAAATRKRKDGFTSRPEFNIEELVQDRNPRNRSRSRSRSLSRDRSVSRERNRAMTRCLNITQTGLIVVSTIARIILSIVVR